MSAVERSRKIIAPVIGLAVGAAIVWTVGWWWLAVPAALLVAAALWVMLAPEGTFDPRRAKTDAALAGMPEMFREEIRDAGERIKALRTLAYRFGTDPLRDTLLTITEHARAILDDVEHAPKDYPRMRKALTHYLKHVETIAGRLDYMARQGASDEAALTRSRATMGDLAAVFQRYRDRMLEDEAFDIDSRLTLLEQEIGAEQVAATRG